jgi:hypothetical protein
MSPLLKTQFSLPAHAAMSGMVAAPNELGVPCYFGRKGLARHYLLTGWAAAEDTHHWNDGYDATLTLMLDFQPVSRLDLRVEGRPYVSPAVPRQDMEVYFNGLRLGFWRLNGREDSVIEATIEPEFWFNRDGVSLGTCVFHLPGSCRPRDIGEAADDRRLGFCFQSFTVAAPVPKLRA